MRWRGSKKVSTAHSPFLLLLAVVPPPPASVVFLHVGDDGVFDERHLVRSHCVVIIECSVEYYSVYIYMYMYMYKL